MSTLRTINVIHPSGSTTNIVNDASGNVTVGNDLTVTGALVPSSSFKRNRLINGNMVVDQRNAGAQITAANLTSGSYMLDRWRYFSSQAAKFTAQQNAGSITTALGFPNYLGMTVSTAVTVGASDYFSISQPVEGFNFADLAWGAASAKPVTLSFVVYSSLTGTFGGVLKNSAGTRSYPFTYSIASANTWTTISVTAAGDTSGTWVGATNGIGVIVEFGLGAGSTYSTTAGVWAAGNYTSATGAVSVVGTAGATFYITGVQLEVGTKATPYEMQIYSDQLAQCQRYYYDNYPGGTAPSMNVLCYALGAGGTGAQSIQVTVPMRAAPSISFRNQSYFNASAVGTGTIGPISLVTTLTASAAGPASASFNFTASAEL